MIAWDMVGDKTVEGNKRARIWSTGRNNVSQSVMGQERRSERSEYLPPGEATL